MKKTVNWIAWIIFWGMFIPVNAFCQTQDTISNWDGTTPAWTVSTGGSQTITNPHQEGINLSEHCFDVVSSNSLYDMMYMDLPEAVNFDLTPRFSLKIYAPSGGGNILLKFENSNNSASQQLLMTPVSGQWTNLIFDFTGKEYDNLTRMKIYFDYLGIAIGNHWLIDDVTRQMSQATDLQSNLPLVVINTFGLEIPDNPKITVHVGIIDNGPGNINHISDPFNNYNGWVGIEIRGQSTQLYPKKAYDFETRDELGDNLNVSLLGLPEDNDWILYAPYADKSMLRNTVSFDLGRKMNRYCSRTVYCELVINGDYKGVYVLMEKIKKSVDRVDIATLKPDEVTGNDLTGGYIIKVDKIDPDFVYDISGWKSNPSPAYPNAMDITFQYFYPDVEVIRNQQKTYIKEYITTAENTLCSSGFTDPDAGYNSYFDVPSFVDFMLMSEIAKEVDKYRYSTYFYKKKDSDGGKLFAGPVWDFNFGYGNVDYWEPGIDYTGWLYQMVEKVDWSIMFWWKRLMEDPYFRDLAKTRWVDLRQHEFSNTNVHAVIDSMAGYIDEAKERNFTRWPILGQYVWPNYDWENNTYADEVDYFENFLFSRISWMDYNLNGNVLQPWLSASAASNKINLHLNRDYFSRIVLKKEDFRLNDAPEGLVIQGVEFLNASECVLTFSIDVAEFHDLSVTLFEDAINTFQDLTSNKLGWLGIDNSTAQILDIKVFESFNQIHIQCDHPELLPDQVQILNTIGQTMGKFSIEKSTENTIMHQLKPGIYLVMINTEAGSQIRRLVVK